MAIALRPIRVANIIEEGKLGGPQLRMAMVARALPPDIETTIIMPQQNSVAFRDVCNKMNVQYCLTFLTRITKELAPALGYLFFSPFEVCRLTYLFKKDRFDVVHVSGGSWQYKGIIAGRLAGCKVVWHLNDTCMPKIFRFVFFVVSRFAHAFIYASERTRNYYQNLIPLGRAGYIIPAPVDTAKFYPELPCDIETDIVKTIAGRQIITTIANINPVKDLELLIDVAKKVSASRADCVFVVVGPIHKNQKKYYRSLKKKIIGLGVENILFVGRQSDVRPLLKFSSVYLCTSRFESSPLSVWEAMSMACPVVSTDVGDVSLYVRDSSNGFISAGRSVDFFAARIIKLLSDPELAKKFGRRGRDIAIKELDVSICASRHEKVYRSLALD